MRETVWRVIAVSVREVVRASMRLARGDGEAGKGRSCRVRERGLGCGCGCDGGENCAEGV